MKTETYNGWKNYQTWNVAHCIYNNESLNRSAVDYMNNVYKGKDPRPYLLFIKWAGLENTRTPDKISYSSAKLDYPALNEMMKEFKKVN